MLLYKIKIMSRIAIVDAQRCKPKKCKQECKQNCPVVLMGKMCIEVTPTSLMSQISESLCNGCGICTRKCPFNAVKIINLPNPITVPVMYRYGRNGFQMHRLPMLRPNKVMGIVGVNGIGKSTIVKLLANKLQPNFGLKENDTPSLDAILQYFRGSELQNYFRLLYSNELTVRIKPQMIEHVCNVPKFAGRTVKDLLNGDDQVIQAFDLTVIQNRVVGTLSGGEAQRLAIALVYSSKANVLFFDEPTNYLDVRQRLRVCERIQELGLDDENTRYVMVVDHDLAMLDFMSDYVSCLYGQAGAYGIVSLPYGTREGLNVYLQGYIPAENVRIRSSTLKFVRNMSDEEKEEEREWNEATASTLTTKKTWDHTYSGTTIVLGNDVVEQKQEKEQESSTTTTTFTLNVQPGGWNNSDVILIVGQNGTGKTTLVRYMAGLVRGSEQPPEFHISYKPQHIKPQFEGTVAELLQTKIGSSLLTSSLFRSDVLNPLEISALMDLRVKELSGGELQRVAITLALGKPADLYLLDEPSSFLDVEMRLAAATAIRRFIKHAQKTCLVVEHDLLMGMYMADRVITFTGVPGLHCTAHEAVDKETGMNAFLKDLNVTIRQDPETMRPRVNKPNSTKDKEQKQLNQYYMVSKATHIEKDD